MEDFVRQAPMQAMNNRNALIGTCGCYHCLETFEAIEVVDWTDQDRTALCPRCNIDSVLPVSDKELLNKIKEYWFEQ